MNDTIRELFSDKALKQLGIKVNKPKKPTNKEYAKLRKRLKEYEVISWYYGTRPIYKVDYDFLEEFMNCSDFEFGGISHTKYRNNMYLHRICVRPNGSRRPTYYMMVTDWDERMIDTNMLKKD